MKGLYATGKEDAMKDNEIIGLYWERNEAAITASADKYGDYTKYHNGKCEKVNLALFFLISLIPKSANTRAKTISEIVFADTEGMK